MTEMDEKTSDKETYLVDTNYLSANCRPNQTPEESKAPVDCQSMQDLPHLWWCPHFAHNHLCPYLSSGFVGVNYWPQVMSKPFGSQLTQTSSHCNQLNADESGRKVRASNTGIASAKTPMNSSNGYRIERLYSCRLCDRMNGVKDEMQFRRHIEHHLGRDRPFVCQICDKSFNFRSICRNHVVAHSVVKHFVPIQPTDQLLHLQPI